MKPLRTALKLPRYCRRKPLKNGRWAYFFEPPTWARKQECPLEAEALGQNYDGAVSRATGRRGSCRRTRSGPGSSLFLAPKSAAPSEQNQPVCRNSRR
jgi:hypothetical protein